MSHSEVRLSYKKASGPEKAYDIVKAAVTPDFLSTFKIKVDLTYAEQERTIKADGKGFTLQLFFKEQECIADLKLSLLLRPMRQKITDRIKSKLAETI